MEELNKFWGKKKADTFHVYLTSWKTVLRKFSHWIFPIRTTPGLGLHMTSFVFLIFFSSLRSLFSFFSKFDEKMKVCATVFRKGQDTPNCVYKCHPLCEASRLQAFTTEPLDACSSGEVHDLFKNPDGFTLFNNKELILSMW